MDVIHKEQESPKGDFNWAAKGRFSERRGRLYTLRLPQDLVTDHCLTYCESKAKTHLNIVAFWNTCVTRTISTIFSSGLYINF